MNLTLDGTDAIVEGYDWWGDDGSGILNDITGQSGGSTLLLRQSDDGNANRYHRLGGTLTDVTIEAQERLIQFVAGCNLNGNIVNINAQGRGDESGIWADPGLGTINYRGGFGAPVLWACSVRRRQRRRRLSAPWRAAGARTRRSPSRTGCICS